MISENQWGSKIDTELVVTWTKALRSGKYKQGKRYLRPADDEYCCLGVLCELAGYEWVKGEDDDDHLTGGRQDREVWGVYDTGDEWESRVLPHELSLRIGMSISGEPLIGVTGPIVHDGRVFTELSAANDSGVTFEEIADIIERLYGMEEASDG